MNKRQIDNLSSGRAIGTGSPGRAVGVPTATPRPGTGPTNPARREKRAQTARDASSRRDGTNALPDGADALESILGARLDAALAVGEALCKKIDALRDDLYGTMGTLYRALFAAARISALNPNQSVDAPGARRNEALKLAEGDWNRFETITKGGN